MKLLNPSDAELNAAFAEKVAGWRRERDHHNKRWLWNDGTTIRRMASSFDFTTSADAVLPYLEKMERLECHWSMGDGFRVTVWNEIDDYRVQDPAFARCAVLALLRAHGVEVEFSK